MEVIARLLAWHTIIFIVPIALGFVAASALMLGAGVDSDALDGDVDDGQDDSESDAAHAALGFLGFGMVPLPVFLGITCFLFGGVGMFSNFAMEDRLSAAVYPWISLALAIAATTALSGPAARLVKTVLPAKTSEVVTMADLVGSFGEITISADQESFGEVRVKDKYGYLHPLACRPLNGSLARGETVYVAEYRRGGNFFIVDRKQALLEPGSPLGTSGKDGGTTC